MENSLCPQHLQTMISLKGHAHNTEMQCDTALDAHDAPRQQLACLEWLRMYDAIAASEDECSSVEYLRRLRSILLPVGGLNGALVGGRGRSVDKMNLESFE